MKKHLLIGLTLALSGCLSSGLNNLSSFTLKDFIGDNVRMTPEHAQTVETAAVISLVEAQPRLHWVASSLKESNLESMVFDDWNARATTKDLMESRLKQKGFTVIGIENNFSTKQAYASSASFAEPDRLRKRLLAAGTARGVDMLVVIYRQQARDFMSKSSQKVTGYGLFKRHSDSDVYAYSAVHVEALNVKKDYVMGKADAKVKISVDSSAWQQNFETDEGPLRLSPVRAVAIRESVIKALKDSTMVAAQEAGISN